MVNNTSLIELRELRINDSCTREIHIGVVIDASCCYCWGGKNNSAEVWVESFETVQEEYILTETRKEISWLRHPPGSAAT